MAKNQHVVPQDGKWVVICEGASKPSSIHPSKQDAIDAGHAVARDKGVSLVVHGSKGQILRSAQTPTTLNEDRLRLAVRAHSQCVQQSKNVKAKSIRQSSGSKTVVKETIKGSSGRTRKK